MPGERGRGDRRSSDGRLARRDRRPACAESASGRLVATGRSRAAAVTNADEPDECSLARGIVEADMRSARSRRGRAPTSTTAADALHGLVTPTRPAIGRSPSTGTMRSPRGQGMALAFAPGAGTGRPPARTDSLRRDTRPEMRRLDSRRYLHVMSLAARAAWPHLSPGSRARWTTRVRPDEARHARCQVRAGARRIHCVRVLGATLTRGAAAIILAIAAPTAAIFLWGRLCAPKAPSRLPMRSRIPVELGVFALAALALAAAGVPGLAAVYAVCAAVNAMVLTRFEQWGGVMPASRPIGATACTT